MSKLTTEDCKNFLVDYFQSRNTHTTTKEWKRTRKYKINEFWYRDFEHCKLGSITLKENNGQLEIAVDIPTVGNKKPTMSSLYQGMCDDIGDKLVEGSIEKTMQSLLYGRKDEYELIGCDDDAVDDDETPVTGYYFHSKGRDYTLLVYSDNSWISSSD